MHHVGTRVGIAEAASFRELYDAHVDFVWRSLSRMGVHQSELDDASQEVFLVVHRCLEQFEGRAKFTTWLFRICFHVASGRRRRGRQRREVLSDSLLAERADHAPDAEALAQRQEDLALLERALNSMSLEQRAVFVLFELEGFTCEQIASTLELPLGTVYSRLRRARALFARSIRAARASDTHLLLREGA